MRIKITFMFAIQNAVTMMASAMCGSENTKAIGAVTRTTFSAQIGDAGSHTEDDLHKAWIG